MASLQRSANGRWSARKRIPNAAREEYGKRFGARHEAKFSAPAHTEARQAKRLFNEWSAEIDARFAAILAERTGDGIALTSLEARALAGEWYDWFIARHPPDIHNAYDMLWDDLWDRVQRAIQDAVTEDEVYRYGTDRLWRDREDVKAEVRPVLADIGETAQFLGAKRLVLNNQARMLFLDDVYADLAAALHRLERLSKRDFSPDTYRERFPKLELEAVGSTDTPSQLFEKWVEERAPATSTVESWRYPLRALTAHFEGRSAASILPEEASAWTEGVVTPTRTKRSVKNNWLSACKAVFKWAADHKHIPRNPFADVKVTVPRTKQLRDTKAFHADEWHVILTAASAIEDPATPDARARRWLPWLCAYSGARSGEIAQLRGADVIEREGVPALWITPEAGTVKGGNARVVPLHEHLIQQGFLEFVDRQGKGPLFYNAPKASPDADRTKQPKPRASQTRQRVAAWVRALGVSDPVLQPNHAWRHTFKQIADRVGISQRMSDYITGHAHRSEGAKYGAPTLSDMATALSKFPRYEIDATRQSLETPQSTDD